MNARATIIFFTLLAGVARADDPIIVQNALITVRSSDLDAELARFPAEQHAEFLSSPARAAKFVENIVVTKTLAAQARAKDLDKDARIQAEIANQADRVLSRNFLDAAERSLEIPDLKGRARELYLLNPSKYSSLAIYEMDQILIETKCRALTEALAIAQRAREELASGKITFAEAVQKYADDPAAKERGGRLDPTTPDRLLPTIAEAIVPLKQGEMTPPVSTPFGVHILRVTKLTPAKLANFELVAPEIIASLKAQFLKDRREAAVSAIRTDPELKVNMDALESARIRIEPAAGSRRPG